MGTTIPCECCLAATTTDQHLDDDDSSTATDEQLPLNNKTEKRHVNRNKHKKVAALDDESYFSSSEDTASKQAADIQQTIMQKSQNEVNKINNTDLHVMDSKTMQLLMDMATPQVLAYTALTVDDDDNTTPALPQNTESKHNEFEPLHKALGGLDYDLIAQDTEMKPLDALLKDDKDLSYTRIKTIAAKSGQSPGHQEIESLIFNAYTNASEEPEESDESSYEEQEKAEIEILRRETEHLDKNKKVIEDMDDLQVAMMKAMEAMKKQNSKDIDEEERDIVDVQDIEKQIVIGSGTLNGNVCADGRGSKQSQLLRKKSAYKWNKQRLVEENEDMRAHMVHLMIAHQSSLEDL